MRDLLHHPQCDVLLAALQTLKRRGRNTQFFGERAKGPVSSGYSQIISKLPLVRDGRCHQYIFIESLNRMWDKLVKRIDFTPAVKPLTMSP